MDRQNGIWNPTGFDSTLSITRTLKGPYGDSPDGAVQKYSYERLPDRPLNSGRNLKLRAAAASGVPLIFFQEIRPSFYLPRYPVFIVEDDPYAGYVDVAFDESLTLFGDPLRFTTEQRRYAERMVQVRLHQKSFRSRVLHAYGARCAVCTLAHDELLDAAHITADGAEDSTTAVTNGLSLCKLHHAAFDRQVIGIDGNYRVHVRADILAEADGPMLKHGLQAMDGRTLLVPRRIAEHPDSERLHRRYLEFTDWGGGLFRRRSP
ncbi:HNH endonuclease [Cryocola sp. 340MFSha3.1]|uniref:HNH endonuclease n=1 Tax=Cryocola sp. 340MFSha3.1 TaxID=1169145 RepID=UPI0018CBC62C|nr:HNH endonuclease [Cryocola sp. 340MFSha3.1]